MGPNYKIGQEQYGYKLLGSESSQYPIIVVQKNIRLTRIYIDANFVF